jgi:hypothetical protein
MTVPLDRLYHFLDNVVNEDIVIYRWFPHGSKLLTDLLLLSPKSCFYQSSNPVVICHDQEPLNYFLYSRNDIIDAIVKKKSINDSTFKTPIFCNQSHINYLQELTNNLNIHNDYILLHSERNSKELDHYIKSGAIPVYYFSHALISRDWFRYAKIDPLINKKTIKKEFLVYQRAWSGTREYRLKFSELLVNTGLHQNCLTKFNPVDVTGTSYTDHQCSNPQFELQNKNLEKYFPKNNISSDASADYTIEDYNQTGIEVVLETLFDDQRWHLTEKTFRPIACGQPFVLAAAAGSLEYVKSYGFKTFGNYIDESYDTISDPLQRLHAIINTMQQIANLPENKKTQLFLKLQTIADHNRQLFFSDEFHNKVVDEYLTNITQGLQKVKLKKGKCLSHWNTFIQKGILDNFLSESEYQALVSKI